MLSNHRQARVGEERRHHRRECVPSPEAGSRWDPAHLPDVVRRHRDIHLQGDLSGGQRLPQRPPQSQVCSLSFSLPYYGCWPLFFTSARGWVLLSWRSPSPLGVQAASPRSGESSHAFEHHREESHQPHVGPGLRRQQPPDPLHPGGLREQ